jgi:nucleotide-binding universal stress UspA family protein
MRILIAYDGSKCAEAAIDDLARGGMPPKGEARIVSVAEVWLPPQDSVEDDQVGSSPYVESLVRTYRESGEKAVAEAAMLAKHAEGRVKKALPGWDVKSSATYGSPAWEILEAARNFGPDLIIVGSQGHSALGRFVLGSISQKVLTEAECSVRVARGSIEVDPAPERVIIGFDGSKGGMCAVEAVASRKWHEDSEVRLVAVTEPSVPRAIGRFVAPTKANAVGVAEAGALWLERAAQTALSRLLETGVSAELSVRSGNPKEVLVEEAERWGADCIFVGATVYGSAWERILLGSTAAAVSARAHCSVEVVRDRKSGRPSEGDPK